MGPFQRNILLSNHEIPFADNMMPTTPSSENSPENIDAERSVPNGASVSRTSSQRRRLLVAVAAGVPTIVAGSAQTAYAAGSSQYS